MNVKLCLKFFLTFLITNCIGIIWFCESDFHIVAFSRTEELIEKYRLEEWTHFLFPVNKIHEYIEWTKVHMYRGWLFDHRHMDSSVIDRFHLHLFNFFMQLFKILFIWLVKIIFLKIKFVECCKIIKLFFELWKNMIHKKEQKDWMKFALTQQYELACFSFFFSTVGKFDSCQTIPRSSLRLVNSVIV